MVIIRARFCRGFSNHLHLPTKRKENYYIPSHKKIRKFNGSCFDCADP